MHQTHLINFKLLLFFIFRGKTTLLNVLAMGYPIETCPTIGLNVKIMNRGGVQMKVRLV